MYKDYSFVFDIAGTLCPIKKKDEKYEDLVPFKDIVEKLRYYIKTMVQKYNFIHFKKHEFIQRKYRIN